MSASLHAFPDSLSFRRAGAVRSDPLADWLDGQARLVAAWRDRLVGEGGDVRLIALLDQHAAFLQEAREAI